MPLTLGQLVDRVRSRLGYTSTDLFQTHAEISEMLRESAFELADLLQRALGEEALLDNDIFTTTVGQRAYSLLGDFQAIRAVHLVSDGYAYPLTKINLESELTRGPTNTQAWLPDGSNVRYLVQYLPQDPATGSGQTIQFFPTPSSQYVISFWGITGTPFSTASNSTLVNYLGHDEYLILDAAAKFAISEQRDPSPFLAQKAAYRERIENLGGNKDESQPSVIRDVRGLPGRYPGSGWNY